MEDELALEFAQDLAVLKAEVAQLRKELDERRHEDEKSVGMWKAAGVGTASAGLLELLKFWWSQHK